MNLHKLMWNPEFCCYNPRPFRPALYDITGETMNEQRDSGDARADAIATTAIVAIVIATVVYWLSGMPS